MTLSPKHIKQFQRKIFSWYEKHQRNLPWRQTRDPYAILVSEIMLQQTQVERVIPKYLAWMERFPDTAALSETTVAEVLHYWSGLGYNRRALYLKKAADEIPVAGQWPRGVAALKKLPGIGEYTARAVACFAFDEQIAVVDTNIRKVIAVEFFNGVLPEEKVIEEVAAALLPRGRAYTWNQALMDYSRLVLAREKIPVPKQSPYRTSRRFYRGKIIRQLIAHKEQSLPELEAFFTSQFGKPLYPLEDIVAALVQEGLIEKSGSKVRLRE